VHVADGGCDADEGNGKEGVEEGLRRWVCGQSSGWVLIVMDDVGCDADAADANVDMPKASRAGGGMAMTSFNYRSSFAFVLGVDRFDLNV
jgi:hypothetical protein